MQPKIKILGLALATLIFAIGCAKDDEAEPQLRSVNGDPWVYVQHTTNNGNNGSLPKELFEHYDNKPWEVSISGFRQQKLNGYNDSDEHFLKGSKKHSSIQMQSTTPEGVELSDDDNNLLVKFMLNDNGGLIVDSRQEVLFDGEKQKVVHYSHTPDLASFSVLLYLTSEAGLKALVSIAATKIDDTPLAKKSSNSQYSYIPQGNYLARWDQSQPLQFDKCFLAYQGMSEAVDLSLEAWHESTSSRLQTTITTKSSCPPFSDLNTHTIQYIDDWISINGPSGVMGSVWNMYFINSGQIVDADMFIYKSELAEYFGAQLGGVDFKNADTYNLPSVKRYLRWVITHEFGHMFGLSHKMEGPKSVMSYDRHYFNGSVFAYDVSAIHYLYPIYDSSVSVLRE